MLGLPGAACAALISSSPTRTMVSWPPYWNSQRHPATLPGSLYAQRAGLCRRDRAAGEDDEWRMHPAHYMTLKITAPLGNGTTVNLPSLAIQSSS